MPLRDIVLHGPQIVVDHGARDAVGLALVAVLKRTPATSERNAAGRGEALRRVSRCHHLLRRALRGERRRKSARDSTRARAARSTRSRRARPARPSQSSTSCAFEGSCAPCDVLALAVDAPRQRKRQRVDDGLHVVLRLQAVLRDLELQRADRAEDRLGARRAPRIEDLHRALFAQLRDALPKRLVTRDVDTAHRGEMFRREGGIGGKATGSPSQSVSPMANAPGLARPTTSPAYATSSDSRSSAKSRIARESRTRAARARVAHGHVALELARADAHERDAVAVARIHVRLNLEDEAGERRRPPGRRPRAPPAAAPSSTNPSRKSCTPKFVTALPKNTGVARPAQHRRRGRTARRRRRAARSPRETARTC